MKTQGRPLTRAIIYLIVEMLCLIIAVIGNSHAVQQPEGTHWFTYGGLFAAALSAYLSYHYFTVYSGRRLALRQAKQDGSGHG